MQQMTAVLSREDDGYVAFCPDLDIASQGATDEEARTNLVEALTLFFETASSSEVARRLHSEVFFTQVEVPVG
jgi:predicted RNase H-like HicB family nuclease